MIPPLLRPLQGPLFISCFIASIVGLAAAQPPPQPQQPGRPGSSQPSRDTSARGQDTAPAPTGRIAGRVVAADNGRPVKHARVSISAAELPGGHATMTDDSGLFDFAELPTGRYTITVSKSGFVPLSYGQRRPLQAGTPLQLGDGQQMRGIDFHLPRGSVIGGRVADEDGEPMAGVTVRVMRYEYQQGDKRLAPAGTSQTDDKGSYRVWDLLPGEYFVNAVARPGFGRALLPATGGRASAGGAGADSSGSATLVSEQEISYAPTYYPGVPSLNEAKPVTVGLSQEVVDINFSMQLVPISEVAGHVTNSDGTPSMRGAVNLITDGPSVRGNRIGSNFSGRIRWDGTFRIASVPPGRYLLSARSDDAETPQFAMLPVTVTGGDVNDLSVVLQPGATLNGTVTLLPGATNAPDPSQMRITAPSIDQSAFGPQPNARLDKDGKFRLVGVPAGLHLLRPSGNTRGWTLKSVTVGGRDVTDTPLELRAGETVSNIAVTFTDQLTEITGSLLNEQGQPAPEYTVLAFPIDASLWRPQARQIMTARPDQTGKYRIRGLPPGEYYLAAVDPAEQGEWFESAYLDEHRVGAARLALADGDVKTQDFKVTIR